MLKKREKETKVNKKLSDNQSVDFNPTDLGKINITNLDGFDPYDFIKENLVTGEEEDEEVQLDKSKIVEYSQPLIPAEGQNTGNNSEDVISEDNKTVVNNNKKKKKKIDYFTLVLAIIATLCIIYIIFALIFGEGFLN